MALRQALAWNNEGIERLQSGQVDEALEFFRQAWAVVPRASRDDTHRLPALVSPESSEFSTRGNESSANGREAHRVPPRTFHVWCVSMDDFMDDDDPPRAPSNVFAVFARPFEVYVNNLATDDELRCANVLSIVLWYNMGLARHMMAVRADGHAEAWYREALESYHRAHDCIRQHVGVYPDAELDLLVLSLLNNMGHCCSSLHDMDQAWTFWDHCDTLWATSSQKRFLSEQERVFFETRVALGRFFKDHSEQT